MSEHFKRISVIGLGYIGLPTAATIASRKMEVIGVDVTESVVNTVNEGKVHIVEPDLDILVRSSVTSGNLRCTTTPEKADAFIIAVPTPLQADKSPSLDYVHAAAKAIAPVLEKGNLVILESTSPVGTTEAISVWLEELRPDLTFPHSFDGEADIAVAHCPERVLPGHILRELIYNDRVIGGITPHCAEVASELYKIFVKGEIFIVDARTAEMSKLTENAFRDVNIAFANELSLMCAESGIDVWKLIELANKHPRVNILQPGPGVGGHCIAVDPWFIVHSHPETSRLVKQARLVNDSKPTHVIQSVREKAERFKKPVIACLGLTFKPDIDDLRESPSLHIVKEIAKEGLGEVLAVEPNIATLPEGMGAVELVSIQEALDRADIVVVLVKHAEFSKLDPQVMRNKILLDFVAAF